MARGGCHFPEQLPVVSDETCDRGVVKQFGIIFQNALDVVFGCDHGEGQVKRCHRRFLAPWRQG